MGEPEKMAEAIRARGDRYYAGTRKMIEDRDRDHRADVDRLASWAIALGSAALVLGVIRVVTAIVRTVS